MIVTQVIFCITGETVKTTATIRLERHKDGDFYYIPTCLLASVKLSWVLVNDSKYYKLNHMVMPITAAVTDMVSSLHKIKILSGICYTATDLKSVFFFYLSKENYKQFAFTW